MQPDTIDAFLQRLGVRVEEAERQPIVLDVIVNQDGGYLRLYRAEDSEWVIPSKELLTRKPILCYFITPLLHESLDALFEECKAELKGKALRPRTSFQTDATEARIVAKVFEFSPLTSGSLVVELNQVAAYFSARYNS